MQSVTNIITPCYNEGATVQRFLNQMERCLAAHPCHFRVIVVDDCSTDDTRSLLTDFQPVAPNMSLDILALNTNVGHQGAIYQGLLYAQELDGDHFIIMDADGEDAPAVIPQLLQHGHADIVHVVRSRRKASLLFKGAYAGYKLLFRIITGRQMNFGNFCLINRSVLERAVQHSFLHFAAFLSKQQGVIRYITADRGERLGGRSKMSFGRLVQHALRSFSEYKDHGGRKARPAMYEVVMPARDGQKVQKEDRILTPTYR